MLERFLGNGSSMATPVINAVARALISDGPLKALKKAGKITAEEEKDILRYAANKFAAYFIEYQYSWADEDGFSMLAKSLEDHIEKVQDWETPVPDFSDYAHAEEVMNEIAVGAVD